MIYFCSRTKALGFTRYRCPAEYQCSCKPGAIISLTTVRRHRDIALGRLRVQNRRQPISLPLPDPFTYPQRSFVAEVNDSSERSILHSSPSSISSYENEISGSYSSGSKEQQDISSFQSPSCLSNYERESNSFGKRFISPSSSALENDSMVCLMESSEGLSASEGTEVMYELDPDERNLSEKKRNIREFLDMYKWHCGFYLRHNQTLTAMDDLLCKDFAGGIKCWKTISKQMLQFSEMEITTYSYCTSYHGLLSHSAETGDIIPCNHPSCALSPAPTKELKYIGLWKRFVARLQSEEDGPELLSYTREGFVQGKQSGFEEKTDFFCGEGFREYAKGLSGFGVDEEDEDKKHLFLFISTDGAPAFRSTSTSFWPVIVYLGNIPPDRRYKHSNIFPVLCIPGNPSDLESFMEPLYEELETLHIGKKVKLWDGREVLVQCHLLNVMGDLPAKKKLCMIKGVNSYTPCLYCEIRGKKSTITNTIYYPNYILAQKRRRNGDVKLVKRNLWNPKQLPTRDVSKTRKVFQELQDLRLENKRILERDLIRETGIIGECELVKRFESVTPYLSMPIDLMHLLFENVAPQMVAIWVGDIQTNENHDYLSRLVVRRKVDKVLQMSGRGIVDSIRRPRGLTERGRWKADEWRTFVLTTSLPAFHQLLPEHVLSGWWYFCQICELAMRPVLREEDMEDLSSYCTKFFEHYSNTYYGGKQSNLHLMRYTIHLLLHIPISTNYCGPLVCFSQFSVERFIGSIKGSTQAKQNYSESVMERWLFEQATMVCEKISGVRIPFVGNEEENLSVAFESLCSNNHIYGGYYLRGYVRRCKLRSLDDEVGFSITSRMVRLYMSDLNISRQEAKDLIQQHQDVCIWNRLLIKKPEENLCRKFTSFALDRQRSASFFAAEFECKEVTEVHYGRLELFLEHSYVHPESQANQSKMMYIGSWASRGLKSGRQQQIYARGNPSSSQVFSTKTVEDVRSIVRNISVLEVDVEGCSRSSKRTYFVDEMIPVEGLMRRNRRTNHAIKQLCGLRR